MSRHYSQHSSHAWPTRGYAAQHNALGLVFSPADHISHLPRSAAFHSVGEQQTTQCLTGPAAGFEISSDSSSDSDMSEEEPDPQESREALDHHSPVSPPPEHWRALIPVQPVYDAEGNYVPLINKLPVELLSLIFRLSMEYEMTNLGDAVLHPDFTPLILSRICSHWREIAIDLPALWQQFMLRPCEGRRHRYRMAHVFIERSKGRGLHIRYSEDGPFEHCPCALNVILENLDSIRTLELRDVGPETTARLSSAARNVCTSIQHFSFRVREALLRPDTTQVITSLYCTSALRHLEWASQTLPCNVPWSQMISIDLEKCIVAPNLFLSILLTAPHLRNLSVRMDRLPPINHRRIMHHSLQHLYLEGVGAQDDILRILHLPNLTELTLHPLRSPPVGTDYSDWPATAPDILHSFIERLAEGLEKLRIIDTGILHESEFLHLVALPQMANLRHLHILSLTVIAGDTLFQRMLPSRYTGALSLLPRLESMRLAECTTTDGVISDMLSARHRLRYPLHRICFEYPRSAQKPHPKDKAAFRELKKHGMDVLWDST
ncbi:hypothetical protein FB107DRAFT_203491 [Schizophyllum commune]